MLPLHLYKTQATMQTPIAQTTTPAPTKLNKSTDCPSCEIGKDLGLTAIGVGFTAFYGYAAASGQCFSVIKGPSLGTKLAAAFPVVTMAGVAALGATALAKDMAAYPNRAKP